jgi:hypothetical protein
LKLLDLIIVTAQSSLLIPAVWLLAAIPVMGLTRLKPGFALSLCGGLAVVSLLTWISLKTEYQLRLLFDFYGTAMFAIAAFIFLRRREAFFHFVRGFAQHSGIVIVFVIYCAMLSCLHILPTLPTDFRFTSIGNNDTFMYMRLADFLLYGSGTGNIDGFDFRNYMLTDVLGAVGYVAYAATLLRVATVDAATPAIISVAAAIPCCATYFAKRWLNLQWPFAFTVGAIVIVSPLAIYHFYSFFLSQTMFNLVLMALLVDGVSRSEFKPEDRWPIALIAFLSGLTTLFVYPALWFQLGATYAAFLLLLVMTKFREIPYRVVGEATFIITCALASYVVLILLFHQRFEDTVVRLIGVTAGWPLGFINPAGFVGFPIELSETSTLHQALVPTAAILSICALLILHRIKQSGNMLPSDTLLVVFVGSLLLYIAIWKYDGATYRQWKFAVSYPSLFGFVPVAFLFAELPRAGRSILTLCLVTLLAIDACDGFWFARARNVHFDQAKFRDLAKYDADPNVNGVTIDLPTFQDRMFSIVFIKNKTIRFSGPTYFGPGNPGLIASRATPAVRF